MKLIVWLFALAGLSSHPHAFNDDPVKWEFSSKKINPSTYEIHLKAKIEDEWHIYSQSTPDGGPVATSISFTRNPLVIMKGDVKEVGKMEQHFEKLFGVEVKQFSEKVAFVQTVTVKAGIKTTLRGTIQYMTCNDEQCMPPKKISFTVSLGK
jgi:thiol:disulfide interchange protein DsbD